MKLREIFEAASAALGRSSTSANKPNPQDEAAAKIIVARWIMQNNAESLKNDIPDELLTAEILKTADGYDIIDLEKTAVDYINGLITRYAADSKVAAQLEVIQTLKSKNTPENKKTLADLLLNTLTAIKNLKPKDATAK